MIKKKKGFLASLLDHQGFQLLYLLFFKISVLVRAKVRFDIKFYFANILYAIEIGPKITE